MKKSVITWASTFLILEFFFWYGGVNLFERGFLQAYLTALAFTGGVWAAVIIVKIGESK